VADGRRGGRGYIGGRSKPRPYDRQNQFDDQSVFRCGLSRERECLWLVEVGDLDYVGGVAAAG